MSIIDIEQVIAGPVKQRTPPLSLARKIGLAVLALWIVTSVYLVAPEQQAVVMRFGRVVEPRVMPGM